MADFMLYINPNRKQKWIYREVVFSSVVLPGATGQVGYWVEGFHEQTIEFWNEKQGKKLNLE